MKIGRSILTAFVFAVCVGLFNKNGFALGKDVSPEVSEDVRIIAATARLESERETIVVYAEGLCCPSCAIGVRKMISKLDFVDRSRFNKGVTLDTKTQLVTVALSTSDGVDLDALSKAIDKAGYEPVRAYSLEGEELVTRSIKLVSE